jgi:arylsulfatase
MPDQFRKYTFDHFDSYWGDHWMNRGGSLRHITDLNKEDALNYLRKIQRDWSNPNRTLATKDKFALTVSFYATHAWDGKQYPDQYMPMNYSEPLYAGMDIPVAKTATEEAWEQMPWFFTEDNEGRKRWRLRFDTPEHYQVSMKRMFRMASEADDVVGAVVKELKEMGVYDDTLLVFTTDNGNFHGGACTVSADECVILSFALPHTTLPI